MKRIALLLLIVIAGAFAAVAGEPAAPAAGSHAPTSHETTAAHSTTAGDGHAADEHHGSPRTYRNTGIPMWILKLVNMLLFFGLLVWLIRKPIGKALAERRANINAQLAEAEARRAKADQLASDIDARLKQIETEVAGIMDRAREEGEKQKRDLVAAAEEEAQRILASARSEADVRLKAAKQELTAYAKELATARAQQLIAANVTDADRKRLFDESVGQIAEVRR